MRREIPIGRKAPDFELPSQEGGIIRLSDYEGEKNVILISFRFAFTPFCSKAISTFNDLFEKFEELNTQLLGIGTDSFYVLKAWSENLGGIKFPLISDFHPHGFTAKKYGLFIEEKGVWKRAVLIVDKNRIIIWKKVYEEEKIADPLEILENLKNFNLK